MRKFGDSKRIILICCALQLAGCFAVGEFVSRPIERMKAVAANWLWKAWIPDADFVGSTRGMNRTPGTGAINVQSLEHQGSLYVAWQEAPPDYAGIFLLRSQIHVARRDASGDWIALDGGGPEGVNTNPSMAASSPRLHSLGGRLYLQWLENTSTTSRQVRVAVLDSNDRWQLIDGGGLNVDPTQLSVSADLSSSSGALYVAWTEGPSSGLARVYVRAFDGDFENPVWPRRDPGSGLNRDLNEHATSVTLAGRDGELWVAWTELDLSSNSRRLRVSQLAAGSWTVMDSAAGLNHEPILDPDLARSANTPRIAASPAGVFVTWAEPNTATVSKIRARFWTAANGWVTADGGNQNGLNVGTSFNALNPSLAVDSTGNRVYISWTENSAGIYLAPLKATNWGGMGSPIWETLSSPTGISYSGVGRLVSSVNLSTAGLGLHGTWAEYDAAGKYQARVARLVSAGGSFEQTFLEKTKFYGVNLDLALNTSEPAAVVANGKLYLAWREDASVTRVMVGVLTTAQGFPEVTPINGGGGPGILNRDLANTARLPSLIECNGRLVAGWAEFLGGIQRIRVSYLSESGAGTTWVSMEPSDSEGLNYDVSPPKVAVFGGLACYNQKPVAIWTEVNSAQGTAQVLLSVFVGTDTAPAWQIFRDSQNDRGLNFDPGRSAYGASVIVFDGKIHAFWMEGSAASGFGETTKLRAAVMTGTLQSPAWTRIDASLERGINTHPSTNIVSDTIGSRISYGIGTAGGQLYVAFSEANTLTNRVLRLAKFSGTISEPAWSYLDGGFGTPGLNRTPGSAALYPSLASMGGDLLLNWTENSAGLTARVRIGSEPPNLLELVTSARGTPLNPGAQNYNTVAVEFQNSLFRVSEETSMITLQRYGL